LYREPDGSWMADLVRQNPLALLVTNSAAGGTPHATHMMAIPDPATEDDWSDDLVGATLLGHLNRANPHWPTLTTGSTALLVFTGCHAYVSPTVYGISPAAPTWNFTAVHVHGVLDLIPPGDDTLHVVQSTVRACESRFGTNWDMSDSVAYFRGMISQVGAFRFTAERAEGMFKLSQEQSPEIRDRVRQSFAAKPCPRHQETADLMGRLPSR
jgi:transcriptional regulator